MEQTSVTPWMQLATVAAGGVAAVAIARRISAAVRIALREMDDRAGDLDRWFKSLR